MSKTANRRWSCPAGKHPGVLAPSRLRKIDVRRYCLECSKAEGVLVERTCAANERRSERSRKKSAKKSASKRRVASDRRRSKAEAQRAREHAAGVDIAREYDRVWAHAVQLHPHLPRSAHPLTVSLRSDGATSGRAYYGHRTHLSVGVGASRVRVCGVIAHEIGHHVAGPEHAHDEVFWSLLAELVEEAYPGTKIGVLDGHHFVKQGAIQDAMRKGCPLITADTWQPPRKPPVRGQRRTKVRGVLCDPRGWW